MYKRKKGRLKKQAIKEDFKLYKREGKKKFIFDVKGDSKLQ